MISHNHFKYSLLSAAIGVSSLAIQMPVNAQEFALEEIVVTAQKREQNLQDVPVAISVMNADAIDRLDIKNFTDVTRVSPSLTMDQGEGPAGNVIRMRGVGTASFSIATEASVSVVVDEVPLVRQAQAFSNLVDIDRVEVLRGPQGTLFGKNASAGLVNIVTKAPSDEFTGSISGRLTDDDEEKVQLSFSGPITETLAYRISGYYQDRDGYITNLTNGKDLNGEKADGLRAKLVWQPTDALDMEVILDSSSKESSSVSTWFEADPSVYGEGIVPGEDNKNMRSDSPNGYQTDQDMAVFKVHYELPGHTLTSVSSYQKYQVDSQVDTDLTDVPMEESFPSFLLPIFDPLGIGGPVIIQESSEESKAFTQEIRLTSNSDTNFEYMLGAFYSDFEVDREFDRKPLVFLLSRWDATAATESMAVFGQGSLSITEDTFLDIGFRLNREKISADFTDYYANGFTSDTPENYSGEDTQNAATGKLALRHFLDNGAMVFGSVSTGYKGQTYDVATGFTQADADNPVGEENSISYELGIKGTTENRRFRYEVVAFLTDFDDYQAQGATVDSVGAPVFALNNVGELRTQGVEADLSFQATENLRLSATVAYVDATLESFENAQCYFGQTEAQGCMIGAGPGGLDVQDLSGEDLNNSPDLKYNLSAYWERSAGSLPFNIFAQANYQWQDDINYSLYGNPLNAQEAYGIANISVGIVEPNEQYKVTFFVNNLFDENYSMGYDDASQRFGGATAISKQWSRNAMRYAGINASYNF
ncbi:TonB-dependent receptor [Aestuariicella hydrocarbonica]|uniref:TonB-dependent receptor n=1 Tax=Pseudomaricurvus hydrocarbonicus TaxID=1470433 RepID=A0A9E5MN74_9GAMM|nr:TonB-dependent receptor [Aestuariicella hydrocarbonica]NHO67361.1 TonB-dependent receptor [Aestuariicella hydrocarbonica]